MTPVQRAPSRPLPGSQQGLHGGDPSSTSSGFPKSIELARAIIAGLH